MTTVANDIRTGRLNLLIQNPNYKSHDTKNSGLWEVNFKNGTSIHIEHPGENGMYEEWAYDPFQHTDEMVPKNAELWEENKGGGCTSPHSFKIMLDEMSHRKVQAVLQGKRFYDATKYKYGNGALLQLYTWYENEKG